MKTIIIFLLTISCYSQVSVSMPLNTIHYKSSEFYAKNQGGSYGAVVTYKLNHFITGLGIIQNSYGRKSNMIVAGYSKTIKAIEFSLVGGVADNYPTGYENIFIFKDGNITKDKRVVGNRVMPMLMLTSKIPIYGKFGIQINVSPLFVNSGVYLNL